MRSIALLCDDKYTSTRSKVSRTRDNVYEKHMKVQYMKIIGKYITRKCQDENIGKHKNIDESI